MINRMGGTHHRLHPHADYCMLRDSQSWLQFGTNDKVHQAVKRLAFTVELPGGVKVE